MSTGTEPGASTPGFQGLRIASEALTFITSGPPCPEIGGLGLRVKRLSARALRAMSRAVAILWALWPGTADRDRQRAKFSDCVFRPDPSSVPTASVA